MQLDQFRISTKILSVVILLGLVSGGGDRVAWGLWPKRAYIGG